TAMAIIAILIGLLVPTITLIQKTAQKVKQKSQFHGIEIALESFRTDFGDYPESFYDSNVDPGYCGAQKLAEAIVGWDGFGVHPQTDFRSDGMNDVSVPPDGNRELIYDVVRGIVEAGTGTLLQSSADNHRVRKGPYLELEAANAVKLDDLYWAVGALELDTYVLVDMFSKVTHKQTNKKIGMPILYYKADVGGTKHEAFPGVAGNVYEVIDNEEIYTAPPPFDNTARHPLDGQIDLFYTPTANPNFPGPPRRPYRSESFIL
ncbi:unnamed protein product, partial [marine sediment metagenome]